MLPSKRFMNEKQHTYYIAVIPLLIAMTATSFWKRKTSRI